MAASARPIKFLLHIKSPAKRNLVHRLANAVWNTPDVLVNNRDDRKHVTLRIETRKQAEEKSGQTVHIYHNEHTGDYEAFRLYGERKDEADKDEPQ